MTPIEKAVAAIRAGAASAVSSVVPAGQMPPGGYAEPVLPDDLQAQVDALAPARFDDFAMAAPEPSFHPDALRFAVEQARALTPLPEEKIRTWYRLMTTGLDPGSLDPRGAADAVVFLCGDFPAAVWSKPNARTILRRLDPAKSFWPSAPLVNAVLEPIAEAMRARLQRLEMIARADPATAGRFQAGPARERTEVYVGPKPPETRGPRRVAYRSEAETEEAARDTPAAVRTIEQQLAAYGLTPETAARDLAATNARRGGKPAADDETEGTTP